MLGFCIPRQKEGRFRGRVSSLVLIKQGNGEDGKVEPGERARRVIRSSARQCPQGLQSCSSLGSSSSLTTPQPSRHEGFLFSSVGH